MIFAYLEKIRDKYIEEKINIESKITEAIISRKENVEFIKLLEENNDDNFEVFTPRTVNNFHKKKIEELKNEQKEIEYKINQLQDSLHNIENELEEVNSVIKDAKERLKVWCFL